MPTATSSASVRPDAAPAARRRCPSHAETPVSSRNATTAAEEHERGAAERLRALAGQLEALERRVDRQEREQPDRQRHQRAQPRRRDAPDPRQPQHAERDRDDADVDAEQRHQPEEADRSLPGVSTATGISCVIVAAGRGQRARPRRPRPRPTAARTRTVARREPADRLARRRVNCDERVVDLRLGDRRRRPARRCAPCSSIAPGSSSVRSTASSSAGGPRRSPRPGPSSA